ncbi:DUF3857 domain-containing protein [Polaribacter sp. MSW13]|uniref:DUF3857 domain-containing protein n=1 Tax=Polaribacter marinus TaxID=2916838 RepID=A0A9X1VNL1_9FLAO|nr:DUF3857 domain-containing protein [Polaribacter marinus]MCI2228878.1 DUF3857 domain-containing protein [Polaribacter marinus]
MRLRLLSLFVFTSLCVTAQEIKFGKVSKEEVQEKFYPLDSTADAAYLYKYRNSDISYKSNSGFIVTTEVHERIKIYTKEGFEKATKAIRYYKPEKGSKERIASIKGYSFTMVDGKVKKQKLSKSSIFDEKLSKYRSIKKITFPNIKEGTVIDLEYQLISPYSTIIDDVDYQFDIPVKSFYCKIQTPEYYSFTKKTKGYYLIPTKSTTKNKSISMSQRIRTQNRDDWGGPTTVTSEVQTSKINLKYNIDVYESKNIPALKNTEPFVTDIKNYRGGIKYELASTKFPNSTLKFYSTTWEDVTKQIYKSSGFADELDKTGYYENDIKNIIAAAKNDFEKIAIIFQHVKKKVKWNNYYGKSVEKGVRKAYKEGTGNVAEINLMLTSMLRFTGLNAYPVLVSTRKNGIPLSPTLDGFNYVVTMVKFPDNKHILLDATEPYSTPNVLPTRALNWNGRVVAKNGGSSWVKLTPIRHTTEENIVIAKITGDLTVEGLVRNKYHNLSALNFRINNNHIKEENLITSFEEANKVEIEDFKILNEYDLGKPISRNIKFTSEDLIEEINGKIYIEPLLFLTQHENPFKLEERKFPVDFTSPIQFKNTVSIQIPAGYKVESLPEVLAIGLPEKLGVFKYQVTQVGTKISTVSILQFNKAIISPEFYTFLKDFYGKVVQKQSEKIVLVKE